MNYTNSFNMPIYDDISRSVIDELNFINKELLVRRQKQIEYERTHTQNEDKRFKLLLQYEKAEADFHRIANNLGNIRRNIQMQKIQQQINVKFI